MVGFLPHNYCWPTCDPGGEDTDPDDTSITLTRSDEYGYGIVDTWEALYNIVNGIAFNAQVHKFWLRKIKK
ncbi:MAG: hypothetical protein ACTSWY_02285 [Promethearchaeota archaeon]